jgi:rhodanese-related sulfurtransferase
MASHGAAREAAKLGYTKVFVMGDGISGWVTKGKPVQKGS